MILAGAVWCTAAVELLAHHRQIQTLSATSRSRASSRGGRPTAATARGVLRLHACKVMLCAAAAQMTLWYSTVLYARPLPEWFHLAAIGSGSAAVFACQAFAIGWALESALALVGVVLRCPLLYWGRVLDQRDHASAQCTGVPVLAIRVFEQFLCSRVAPARVCPLLFICFAAVAAGRSPLVALLACVLIDLHASVGWAAVVDCISRHDQSERRAMASSSRWDPKDVDTASVIKRCGLDTWSIEFRVFHDKSDSVAQLHNHGGAEAVHLSGNRMCVVFEKSFLRAARHFCEGQSTSPSDLIAAVTAHEIGHLAMQHAKWTDFGRILASIVRTLMTLMVASMAGWISDTAVGQTTILATYGWAIGYKLANIVVVSALDPWIRACLQAQSRTFEYSADAAASSAGLSKALVVALELLQPHARDDPLYSLLYKSHPDMSSRIERILHFEKE
jgi:hypothetical protein